MQQQLPERSHAAGAAGGRAGRARVASYEPCAAPPVPVHLGVIWSQHYERGVYISSVYGATGPFTVEVLGYPSIATVSIGILRAIGLARP
jgi:hypothetical protein